MAGDGVDWGGFFANLGDTAIDVGSQVYVAKNTPTAEPVATGPAMMEPELNRDSMAVSTAPTVNKELLIMGAAGVGALLLIVIVMRR